MRNKMWRRAPALAAVTFAAAAAVSAAEMANDALSRALGVGRPDAESPRLIAAFARSAPQGPIKAGPWVFETLSVPGPSAAAADINEFGDIVGNYYDDSLGITRGFQILDGEFEPFDVPGSSGTTVNGINNTRMIGGAYADPDTHGWLMVGQVIETIDYPGHEGLSWVRTINNNGDLTGLYCTTFACQEGHGYARDPAGNLYPLPDHPDATLLTFPLALNDRREVAGYYRIQTAHGYAKGAPGFLSFDFPGAVDTGLLGFRNDRVAVGSFSPVIGEVHGLILRPNGDFRQIDYPGGEDTQVWGINDAGDLVGDYLDPATQEYLAFVAHRVAGE